MWAEVPQRTTAPRDLARAAFGVKAIRLAALPERGERGYRRPAMADEPDNIVLLLLRRIDTTVVETCEDLRELKVRMTTVAERLANVELSVASTNRRIDRVEVRLDRIERRLDLVELPH